MRTRPNGLYTYPRGGTAGRLAFAAYLALTLACGGGALLLLAAFTALKPSSPEPAPPRSIPPSKIASVDT
ncbi:MAG: hypothetical protein HY023_16090, partial [Chloroflexi bacterium]|nr:hypothetical protein [Chloroflexota bacterium]